MVKQICRYSLLVLCCLLIAGYLASVVYYWKAAWYGERTEIGMDCGNGVVGIFYGTAWGPGKFGGGWSGRVVRARPLPDDAATRSLLLFGEWTTTQNGSSRVTHLIIPLWMPTVLLSLLTAALWYRPLSDRFRGNHRTGFPVEAKQLSDEQSDV